MMRIIMDSTEPGANTTIKIKLLREVSLITFLCLQLASRNVQAICNDDEEIDPQAPDCLDDCQGRRFFLDRDGICKMCVQCEPGFQHDKYCGDGENGDAICIPCPEDHFSYNLYDCVACRVCENTLITQECTPSTDRQCGECLPGYYKDPQNPDLCNQRCEWLSNPQIIPSCRDWLADKQATTLSADMSQMSSFPMTTDQGSGHMSWTLIIIILLIFVLIAGSIIPVYFCCKYYRRDSLRPNDMETGTDHNQEHHEPADIGMDSMEQHCNSNGSTLNGAVTCVARVVPNSRTDVASKPVIDFQISTCPVQHESNVSIPNEEEKSEEMLMSIDSEGGQANELREGADEEDGSERPDETLTLLSNGPPKVIHVEGTVIGQVTEEHKPEALYSEEAGRSKEMARANEGDGGNGRSDEQQRLLPVVALGSTKGADIKKNDKNNVEHMPPSGLASEVAKGEDEARADEGDDCKEELNKHQNPNAGVKDQTGGAEGVDDEEWIGSAEEERTQPIKGKKEKEASKTKPLQQSWKRGKTKKKKAKPHVTFKIFGRVNTLVMGNQIQNHNNYNTVREGENYEEEEEEEEEDSDQAR